MPTPPNESPPRMGDHVHHEPSGEDWVVLYTDGENLGWMGWPPGEAKLSDCTVVTRCTDETHQREITRIVTRDRLNAREHKALRLAGVTRDGITPGGSTSRSG
jgi:hypothetical protein